MKKKKMPNGGKLPILPYGVRPNTVDNPDSWNAASNNQLLTGIQQGPRAITPFEKLKDVEQGAYDRYQSTPQKAYPDSGAKIGKLSTGKLRGANPNQEMMSDLVAAADKAGVSRSTMLGLAANESMFGMGYRTNERTSRSQQGRGVLQQNVISSWDMDNQYRPVPATQFAYQKGIPGVDLVKDKQGYMYNIRNHDQYVNSIDSALTVHPEWVDQYRNANSGVIPKGDINYFDQTADALKTSGLSSARFNPGDPDYANKVNGAAQLVNSDPTIQQFLKNYDAKKGSGAGSMKKGGSIELYAKDGIHINPANKGKFTASASKAGMSVSEFANHVMKNKGNYSATQVKRANFARNAAKWHKAEFGIDMPYYNQPYQDPMQQQPQPYQEDPRLSVAKQKITGYFQDNPDQGWVPNDATMQGADPDQDQYLTDEDGNIKKSDYDPRSGDSRTTSNIKNIGQSMPNIHLNAGVAINALAGFVTKGLKKAQAVDEAAILKRRQLTGQTYNPNAYGTGSQAIMKNGGMISKYQLTPEQAQFLKKQGYNI
jgi:hypothetical protein